MFIAEQLPVHLFLPSETSEMFRHFVLTTKTFQPRPRVFSVNCMFSFLATIELQRARFNGSLFLYGLT